MKRILLFALLLLAVACGDPIQPEPQPGPEPTPVPTPTPTPTPVPMPAFKASFTMSDDYPKLGWMPGALISVFANNTINTFYQSSTGSRKEMTFEIVSSTKADGAAVGHIYAVCPYNKDNSIETDGRIHTFIPTVQYWPQENIGGSSFPMVAISDSDSLSFKPYCGFLKVRFYGNDILDGIITLRGNSQETLSGAVTVSILQDGTVATTADTLQVDLVQQVQLSFIEPVTLSETRYIEICFAIPPVVFEKGFTLQKQYTVDDSVKLFETTDRIVVSANQATCMEEAVELVDKRKDTTSLAFEDPAFTSYLVSRYDQNKDGKISVGEAQDFYTVIITQADNISSVKGIENFPNLGMFSYSPASNEYGENTFKGFRTDDGIYHAYVYSDDGMKHEIPFGNLTELDLSNNKLLHNVKCIASRLTTLILPETDNLKNLTCDHNQLTSIDLSGCPSLTLISCEGNQLTSLDVSDCPDLGALECSYNKLTKLSLHQNTKLSMLDCSDNQLTELDVSHNTALNTLWCQNNPMTTLYLKTGQTFSGSLIVPKDVEIVYL